MGVTGCPSARVGLVFRSLSHALVTQPHIRGPALVGRFDPEAHALNKNVQAAVARNATAASRGAIFRCAPRRVVTTAFIFTARQPAEATRTTLPADSGGRLAPRAARDESIRARLAPCPTARRHKQIIAQAPIIWGSARACSQACNALSAIILTLQAYDVILTLQLA